MNNRAVIDFTCSGDTLYPVSTPASFKSTPGGPCSRQTTLSHYEDLGTKDTTFVRGISAHAQSGLQMGDSKKMATQGTEAAKSNTSDARKAPDPPKPKPNRRIQHGMN